MTSSSNGEDDDRRPKSTDWGAINQVSKPKATQPPQTAPPARPPARPPAHSDVRNAPPRDAGTVDMRPGSYRNYRAPLIGVMIGAVALGVGYLTLKEDKVDLQKRPAIHFSGSTLQQAGQVPENIKAPPPPPRRTVRFDSEPAGARVIINERVAEGLTPLEAAVNTVGPVHIRIVQGGFQRYQTRLTPAQTQLKTTLTATPKKPIKAMKPAILEVTTSPAGARVLVDGEQVGVTPLKATALSAAGSVSISLLKEGHYPYTVVTSLHADKTRNIGVRLSPANDQRATAQIQIESNPNGATIERILADGKSKRLGKTSYSPLVFGERIGTTITVRASAPGHLPATRHFDLHASDYTVQLHLAPPVQTYGTMSVKGPRDLMVYLNSDELDALPVKKQRLKSAVHKLVVVDQKTRKRATTTFTVTEKTEVKLEIQRANDKIIIKNLTTP